MDGYIYDYAVASLVFLLVIVFSFFFRRQFPSVQNHVFKVALICALADSLFDITSSMMIDSTASFPLWLVMANNTVFYCLQVIFPTLIISYVTVMAQKWHRGKRSFHLLMTPAALMTLLVLTNWCTRLVFFVNADGVYQRGRLFWLIYVNAFFYVITAFVLLIRYRKILSQPQKVAFLFSLFTLCAVLLLQSFMPRYLLTGLGICLAMTLMFLIMQKPEDMQDTTTGVYGREAMFSLLAEFLRDGRSFQIITVELHNLRRINKVFGFGFGNDALRAVAQTLSHSTNKGWTFRFIGNIFAVITTEAQEHCAAKQKIESALSCAMTVDGVKMSVLTSICSIDNMPKVKTVDGVCTLIELMLAEVPRGTVNVVSQDMLTAMERRGKIEAELVEAIDNDSFEVWFQPLYCLQTGKFEGAEALARFRSSELGSISPAEFIPIAEKHGLIGKIDHIVLKKVCAFIQSNKDLEQIGIACFSVNLSAIEFISGQLSQQVTDTVDAYKVEHTRILFEITESTVASEFSALHLNVEMLSKNSFTFVLDDFGTGFSNISSLTKFPFSIVKLDKSMLASAMNDSQNRVILMNSLRMFRELGIKTVVEGVETQEEMDMLERQHVNYLQGYYLAKPMPPELFLSFVRRHCGC